MECAHWLHDSTAGRGINFERLYADKEAIRQDPKRQPRAIDLGGIEFYLLGQGSGSGYPFMIQNRDCTIAFGEFNRPSFFVTFRSEALWREGANNLHQRFLDWASSLGFRATKEESLSRVDFAFDFYLESVDIDADSVISMSAKDASFRKDRKTQTIQFGAGGDAMLRIYNKSDEIAESSGKVWFYPLWGGATENVWRVEWQVRKGMLRRFGIRSFESLMDMQGDLLHYLAHEHDTLRVKSDDSNRSRWAMHPFWLAVQEQVRVMPREGVLRCIDPKAAIQERLYRSGIAVYGYLKNIAALEGALSQRDFVEKNEAQETLRALLACVHDPITWKTDVQRRIVDVRLGR